MESAFVAKFAAGRIALAALRTVKRKAAGALVAEFGASGICMMASWAFHSFPSRIAPSCRLRPLKSGCFLKVKNYQIESPVKLEVLMTSAGFPERQFFLPVWGRIMVSLK